MNFNLLEIVEGQGTNKYDILAIGSLVFSLLSFIILFVVLYNFYKKHQQIPIKSYFVSTFISINLLFLSLFFIWLASRAANHEANTFISKILNRSFLIIFYIIVMIFDSTILSIWVMNPKKIDPNNWEFLLEAYKKQMSRKKESQRIKAAEAYKARMAKNTQTHFENTSGKKQEETKKEQTKHENTHVNKKQEKKTTQPKKKKGLKNDFLYRCLGLEYPATDDQIKQAYRKLAKKYHPDITTEENAAEKFMRVQKAYDVLSDPKRKLLYDEEGIYQ